MSRPPRRPFHSSITDDPDFAKKLAAIPDAPGRAPAKTQDKAPHGVNTTPQPKLPGFEDFIRQIPDAPKDWRKDKPAFFTPLKTVTKRLRKKVAEKQPKKLGAANLRVVEAAANIMADQDGFPISYQHTVLCQTSLPYRDPGKEVLNWDRNNGLVSLSLSAGRAFHPSGKWVQMGLPYGPKPRQILAYLNTQAILQQRPVIDVEASLNAFIRAMGYDNHGRNFKMVKDQIARLAAADFRMGITRDAQSADTHKGTIVSSFNLWCEKDDKQRVFWPRQIVLDDRYFASLVNHAVPLDTRAIAALGHSAMALDIYAWLAQRLHRIHPQAPAMVTWASLATQFGDGFTRVRKFREKFLIALRAAKVVYPAASIELDKAGIILLNSPPPVRKRAVQGVTLEAQTPLVPGPKDKA